MAGYKKRGPKKKPTAHGGKLMIVLRSRHTVWIDVGPEEGRVLLAQITGMMVTPTFKIIAHGDDTIRAEDVVHVKYIPPSVVPPAETEKS